MPKSRRTKKPQEETEQHVTRFLDPAGSVVRPLPEFAEDAERLIPLYEAMVFLRAFDEKAVALQRTGRLGTYASALGQEAVSIGAASAMKAEDVLLPSFREQGAMLWRGVRPLEVLLYWGGDERGNDFEGPRHDFPISIPVASHFPHAAGVALAMKLAKEKRVAVAIAGDGATSKGDFYEALNIVGVWELPAVFIINNNQWAISVPRARQTAARTLADKAVAAGVASEQVDGNDVIAMRDAVERALARARAKGLPTLIEALTYRLGDHTTADDAHRYRSDAEVSARWKEEPTARLRAHLVSAGAWTKEKEEALHGDCARRIAEATDAYLAYPPPAPQSMFTFTFQGMPADLERQMTEAGLRAEESP